MRQILSIAFLCAIITLVGCTDEVTQDVVQSYVKQNTTSPLTRTASLDVSVDTTTQELQETEDLKVLRSKCRKAHSVLKRVNMMSDDDMMTHIGAICMQLGNCHQLSRLDQLHRVDLPMATPIFTATEKAVK